jgi:hypothetical protein
VKSFDLFVAHMGEGQGQILTLNQEEEEVGFVS